MIRVLLADDHDIVRLILRQVLEKAGDIEVVSMASNGQEAVNGAIAHFPNVAVLDVSMPIMDGVAAAKQISLKCLYTHVLMVSAYNTPRYVHSSIAAGASGYVLKDAISSDLVAAVRTLHQGNRYFSEPIALIAEHYIHPSP